MKKVVITSGYYNPAHIGHLNLMREAKIIGSKLVVIVNNDEQVKQKGSVPFMSEKERLAIVKDIRYVDEAFLSIDKDRTVVKTLEKIFKKHKGCDLYFAKGGDSTSKNVPELQVCEKYNAKVIFGVGGGKVQSSSWLLKNSAEYKAKQA